MHLKPLRCFKASFTPSFNNFDQICIEVLTSACKDQPSLNTQFLTLLDHQNFSSELLTNTCRKVVLSNPTFSPFEHSKEKLMTKS